MRIDQRNAGAAVTTSDSFPVDRFIFTNTSDGSFSAQQDSSAPAGFVNSIKVTTTTADGTLTTTQRLILRQFIEGLNVADLAWGTASAKTVTLSFWVRSSLTGTFGGVLQNSALNRTYPFTYTISAADTWEQKSVTIAGDTSGTWLTTNGRGIALVFSLGSGPDRVGTAGSWAGANYTGATGETSVIGTLNATWYVTGVQLEVGSVATPFERRPFGAELMLCQRYYEKSYDIGTAPGTSTADGVIVSSGMAGDTTTNEIDDSIRYKVTKRATPTVTIFDTANPGNSGKCDRVNIGLAINTNQTVTITFSGQSNSVVRSGSGSAANRLSYHYTASAEL
jgi:hypothetical protein